MSASSCDGRTGGGAAPRRGSAEGAASARGAVRALPADSFCNAPSRSARSFSIALILPTGFLARGGNLRRDFRRALQIDPLQSIERSLYRFVGRRPFAQAVLGDDPLLGRLVALRLRLRAPGSRLPSSAATRRPRAESSRARPSPAARRPRASAAAASLTCKPQVLARPALVEDLLVDRVPHPQRAVATGARRRTASARR